MSEWISVEDRLPLIFTPVLVKQIHMDQIMIAEINSIGFWLEQCENKEVTGDAYISHCITKVNGGQDYLRITHWMPLPEPPQ